MKRYLFLLPVAFLAAAPSNATESRIQGMGGIGLYMIDDTNIFVFPQMLSKYAGTAQFELGTVGTNDASRHGGGAVKLHKLDATAGLYVNRSAGAPLQQGFSFIDPDAENRLIFAKDSWGAALGMGSDTWEDKETEAGDRKKESGTNFSFAGGGDFRLGKAAAQVGAEVAIGSGSIEFDDNAAAEVDESSFAFRFANRNFYNRGSKGKLVSVLTFGLASNEVDPDGDVLFETSSTTFGVGAGWHQPVGKDVTVILGCEPVGFATTETTDTEADGDEDKDTFTTLSLFSVFLAAEGPIKDWLHGRASISQANRRNTSKSEFTPDGGETSTSETTFSSTDINFALGLSFLFGDHFTLDMLLNDQYLNTGPHFLSGSDANGTGPLFTKVSANVAW